MHRHLLFIPGPVTCAQPVLEAMAKPMIDHRGPEFAALLGRIARGMRPIFGTQAEVVILGCSGTGGLEAAVASVFSPGQRVLAAPVGVFGKRLVNIARAYGLEVELLDTPYGHAVDPAALEEKLKADRAHPFAGILLTHNETSTGVQNDMAALAAAIGDHPATTVVDSVSGLGASPFEMDAWGYDIVVTATQKALAVPPGISMVAVSARGWERIAQAKAPRFYLDLATRARICAAGPDAVDAAGFDRLRARRRHRTLSRRGRGQRLRAPRSLRACDSGCDDDASLGTLLAARRALGHGRCATLAGVALGRCDPARAARGCRRRDRRRPARPQGQDSANRDDGRAFTD